MATKTKKKIVNISTKSKKGMGKCCISTPIKVLKNNIIFIIDKSGSMSHLTGTVVEKYNNLIREFKENSLQHGHRTEISTYLFSTSSSHVISNENVNNTRDMTRNDFYASGGTALFDAVGQAIQNAKHSSDFNDPDASFLVLVLTDGEENSSRNFTQQSLRDLIKEVDFTNRWTITFQVPPGAKSRFLAQFPLYSDNVTEWEATEKGMEDVETKTSGGIKNFYSGRAIGLAASKSFFTPDINNIKKNLTSLTDLSSQYHILTVSKDEAVKKYIEASWGPWIKGNVYYELIKPEIVQHNKNLLVRDKAKNKVYGGKEARDLAGLPDYDLKVNPASHPTLEIYCQSTSVNRALKKGQRLLIKR